MTNAMQCLNMIVASNDSSLSIDKVQPAMATVLAVAAKFNQADAQNKTTTDLSAFDDGSFMETIING